MNHRKHAGTDKYGLLPAAAPLANPYVPFQSQDPARYEPDKGLIRGTIYPGLDLPFQGCVNKTPLPNTPKTQLQTLAFVLQELALYLDTHPQDTEALALYRQYQQRYAQCQEAYTHTHGPSTHLTPDSCGQYRWLTAPWPWEYAANKEG